MALSPVLRKLLLTIHLLFSIGWIGGVIAYLTLGVATAASDSAETIRGAWIAMDLTGWFTIVPLAVGSLASGVLISLGTKWGLFRHYWVIISLALTVVANVVLVLHMPGVSATADFARTADAAGLATLGGDLLHPTVGLVVLLAVQVLNIYKPRGLTRYGWRRQEQHPSVCSTRST